MSKKIEGVLTAIVTPFDEEGGLNVQSLKRTGQSPTGCRKRYFLRRHKSVNFCAE